MLNGKEKQIALDCVSKLEDRLTEYQKFGFPKAIGMQGLFEMNTKDTIEYKIKNIKQIIHRPGKDSLADIEPYCKSHLPQATDEAEQQRKFVEKLHKKYNIKPLRR